MYGTNHLKVAKSYLYTLTMRFKNATFSKKDAVDTVHFNHSILYYYNFHQKVSILQNAPCLNRETNVMKGSSLCLGLVLRVTTCKLKKLACGSRAAIFITLESVYITYGTGH
jgi:hypothetical protein